MPSWFDLFGLDPDSPVDEAGIVAAADRLRKLVEAEAPETRVVLGGFSQGGAVALTCGLRCSSKNVKALVGASTWLPLADSYVAGPQKGASTVTFQL